MTAQKTKGLAANQASTLEPAAKQILRVDFANSITPGNSGGVVKQEPKNERTVTRMSGKRATLPDHITQLEIDVQDYLEKLDNQEQQKNEFIAWLMTWGFTTFWTLTFNPKKFPDGATYNQCNYLWLRAIVENLNSELFGKHYRRIVGHSYFGYVVGIEPHQSGLLHIHAATTDRTHWAKACEIWQNGRDLNIGTIEIRPIDNMEKDLRYVLKYVTKADGCPLLYRPVHPEKKPPFQPYWYTGK